jgi:hypothetical protein
VVSLVVVDVVDMSAVMASSAGPSIRQPQPQANSLDILPPEESIPSFIDDALTIDSAGRATFDEDVVDAWTWQCLTAGFNRTQMINRLLTLVTRRLQSKQEGILDEYDSNAQLLNPKAEVYRTWSAVLGRVQSKIDTWIDRSGYASESHSPIRVSPGVDIKPEPDVEMKLYSTEISAYEAHSPVYPRYSLEPRGDSAEAHGSNERKPIMIMRSTNELVIGLPPRGSNEAEVVQDRDQSSASALQGMVNHSAIANSIAPLRRVPVACERCRKRKVCKVPALQ